MMMMMMATYLLLCLSGLDRCCCWKEDDGQLFLFPAQPHPPQSLSTSSLYGAQPCGSSGERRAAKGNSLNVYLSVFPPIRSTRPVRLLSAARRPGPANPAEHDEPTAQRTLSAGETPHPSDGALYNNSNNDDDDGGRLQVGWLAAEG